MSTHVVWIICSLHAPVGISWRGLSQLPFYFHCIYHQIFFFFPYLNFFSCINFFLPFLPAGTQRIKMRFGGGLEFGDEGADGADGQKQKETKHPYFFLYPFSHTKLHSGDILASLCLWRAGRTNRTFIYLNTIYFPLFTIYKTDDAILSCVSTVHTRSIKVY